VVTLLVPAGRRLLDVPALRLFRLIHRALAAFGLLGALGQIAGVTLRGLWGYPPETRLAIPLAPAYVAVAVWLMVKGFYEPENPLSTVGGRLTAAGRLDVPS
jgi:hypothetical protein